MHTGHVISGAGHLALIGWMFLGGLFAREPEPLELTQVSVISSADFEAMIAAQQPPQSASEVAQPAAPQVETAEPDIAPAPEETVAQPVPDPVEVPQEDTPPEVPEPPTAAIDDVSPELSEPVGDVAVLVPDVAPQAAPQPIERVAPEPVAQPEPEATPDPVEQEAVAPDELGEAPEQENQEATAPEEAVTEIVTEATAAPAASSRPPGRRPEAPARQVVAAPPTEVETQVPSAPAAEPVSNDDILAALQAAEEPSAPSGPPLSSGEREALRVAVSQCWNVGSLSSEAMGTTVVVGVDMTQDSKPVQSSIRMLSASGGSDAAARRVFDSARRAIILCGARGLNLPPEKYSQWQKIEMTFDPRKMALR